MEKQPQKQRPKTRVKGRFRWTLAIKFANVFKLVSRFRGDIVEKKSRFDEELDREFDGIWEVEDDDE